MLVLRMLKDQSRPPQLDSVIILLDKVRSECAVAGTYAQRGG